MSSPIAVPRLRCLALCLAVSHLFGFGSAAVWPGEAGDAWVHLSSADGDLPVPPGGSTQQTGAVVGDFDKDGVQDFVLSFRQKPPALVWYRRASTGWELYVVEKDYLTIEAGGAVQDIDNDGDLDIVFGGDWQSPGVWWWENPAPDFDKQRSWKRRTIKADGKHQHHDQVFADLLGTGAPQLAFWNQQAQSLFLAPIPPDVHRATSWPVTTILSGVRSGSTPYIEGLSAADIDADGQVDLLAYNMWFKHLGGGKFQAVRISDVGGLICAGQFKPGAYPQIVISPGDGNGPLRWYECVGDPTQSADWTGHDLLDRDVVHGHSLQLGDIDRDGHLDIFMAEMAQWHEGREQPDHPGAIAFIFYGDGAGAFRRTELVRGHGWHEARLADLDGDGDLDVLNKPYTWKTPRVDVWLQNGTGSGT